MALTPEEIDERRSRPVKPREPGKEPPWAEEFRRLWQEREDSPERKLGGFVMRGGLLRDASFSVY